MIAASVFDGLDFAGLSFAARARLRAIREANEIAAGLYDEAPARSSATSQASAPSRGMPAAPAAPRQASYLPASGSRIVVTPEEEERRRRPVAAAGAGIVAARPVLAVQSMGAIQEAYAVEIRSVEVKRAALAMGSQAAVVKLASYANGRARVSALLTYQSHDGELALEREDGSHVQGKEAIQSLVARWQEDAPTREPSKDVLSFTLTIDDAVSQKDAQEALAEALAGHRYAFRIEEEGGQSRLHVVMSAASSQRDEQGRAVRIFDTKKSLGALESRLSDSFDGATFQAQGFLHGVEGAAISLLRLSKRGEQTVITSKGKVLTGEEAARSEAKSWKRDLRSTDQREVAHIIFSAKPGTDKDAFVSAVRATLEREFPGREYVFALHTNRQHIHVHAAVRLRDIEGKKLNPRIQDLQRWRETLAQEARQRNIPMEAVSRFEQAHVPGYKLKDIRRVERGTAPESARRRVEAAQTRAIHIPTREEGRKRANEVARGWQAVAIARASGPEPSQAPDTIRLYRAERPGAPTSSAPLFARDRATAETLAASFKGSVSYVDVPRSRLSEVTPSRTNPEAYVTVSRDLAARQQPLTPAPERRVLELQERTRTAIEHAERQSEIVPEQKGKPTMPTLERMESTIDSMETNMAAMIEAAPEEARPNLEVWAVGVMQDLEEAVAEKRKQADSRRPDIEGDRYVEPIADSIQGFRSKARGSDIHYFRETPTGEKLAFIDNGRQVKIYDWKDRESVRAALQLSSEKWNGLAIKGNDEYKSLVVSLAAEHGFKITNPELQERIAAERQRLGKSEPVKETAEVREAAKQTAPQPERAQASPALNPTSSATATEPKAEAAGKPEAPASKAEAAPTARPEKDSAERPPMVGVLVKVGEGPYKDDPKNDVSQYVDLRTEDGRVHRIWSVQVAKDLKAADAQPGETVKAQYLGNEHVTKPVPVRDEKTGEVTHREEKSVERGVWRTEVVRQVEKEQPAKSEAQAAKPEAKAAEPETANNAEQQAQRQERDRAEDQRQEQQRRETERRQTQKPRNRH